MVARCNCGLVWNISVKAEIPKEGYECPKCEAKRKRALVEPKPIVEPKKNKKKSEGRTSNVLLRNRERFSISNNC